MAGNNLPPLNKMASPQMIQFNASVNMPGPSIHPLSMSTSSSSSLQPGMMTQSLSMTSGTSNLPQSIPMGGGLGATQLDSSLSAYSTETVRPNGFDGTDISRSTSAFKVPPTMSSSAAQNGVSSDILGYSQMGGSSLGGHTLNGYSSNRGGSSVSGRSDSPDYSGRKIYVSNVGLIRLRRGIQLKL